MTSNKTITRKQLIEESLGKIANREEFLGRIASKEDLTLALMLWIMCQWQLITSRHNLTSASVLMSDDSIEINFNGHTIVYSPTRSMAREKESFDIYVPDTGWEYDFTFDEVLDFFFPEE